MKAVAEKLALFTYSWRGGTGLGGCEKGAAGCRITTDYASKHGADGRDRVCFGGCKGLLFRRITGAAPHATRIFFRRAVLAYRKFSASF